MNAGTHRVDVLRAADESYGAQTRSVTLEAVFAGLDDFGMTLINTMH